MKYTLSILLLTHMVFSMENQNLLSDTVWSQDDECEGQTHNTSEKPSLLNLTEDENPGHNILKCLIKAGSYPHIVSKIMNYGFKHLTTKNIGMTTLYQKYMSECLKKELIITGSYIASNSDGSTLITKEDGLSFELTHHMQEQPYQRSYKGTFRALSNDGSMLLSMELNPSKSHFYKSIQDPSPQKIPCGSAVGFNNNNTTLIVGRINENDIYEWKLYDIKTMQPLSDRWRPGVARCFSPDDSMIVVSNDTAPTFQFYNSKTLEPIAYTEMEGSLEKFSTDGSMFMLKNSTNKKLVLFFDTKLLCPVSPIPKTKAYKFNPNTHSYILAKNINPHGHHIKFFNMKTRNEITDWIAGRIRHFSSEGNVFVLETHSSNTAHELQIYNNKTYQPYGKKIRGHCMSINSDGSIALIKNAPDKPWQSCPTIRLLNTKTGTIIKKWTTLNALEFNPHDTSLIGAHKKNDPLVEVYPNQWKRLLSSLDKRIASDPKLVYQTLELLETIGILAHINNHRAKKLLSRLAIPHKKIKLTNRSDKFSAIIETLPPSIKKIVLNYIA